MTTTPKPHLRLHYNHGLWAIAILVPASIPAHTLGLRSNTLVGFTTSSWAIEAGRLFWWGVAS